MNIKRVVLIVMDGCGAGAAPDAAMFGDRGEDLGNTLVNTAVAVGGLNIPTLRKLGLGNVLELAGGEPLPYPIGSYGRLCPLSKGGKDTITGHWEMMGIILDTPFPTYPNGFLQEIIDPFCKAIGSDIIGNYTASGTEIIKQLGREHMETAKPIVYTSADSVFQIAAHEEVIPPDRLYEICHIARNILKGPHAVQRVIARPFLGNGPWDFKRTEHRKDFTLTPPENVLDHLAAAGVHTTGLGIVPEVFEGRGFSDAKRTQNNVEHFEALMLAMESNTELIFVNFEDFDMLYGHRNDPAGFAKALETFDGYTLAIMAKLKPTDLLIISADHGNDPTTPSTDHTREHVPILVYSPILQVGIDYGTRTPFSDIGATIAQVFGVALPSAGKSLIA
ncbi:MAG: phosphopentomutase [bacterium]